MCHTSDSKDSRMKLDYVHCPATTWDSCTHLPEVYACEERSFQCWICGLAALIRLIAGSLWKCAILGGLYLWEPKALFCTGGLCLTACLCQLYVLHRTSALSPHCMFVTIHTPKIYQDWCWLFSLAADKDLFNPLCTATPPLSCTMRFPLPQTLSVRPVWLFLLLPASQ